MKRPTINTVQLAGQLTRDPEVLYTSEGNALAHFTLAVPNPRNRETPTCIDVSATDSLCDEVMAHTRKRTPVEIKGSLVVSQYADTNGHRRKLIEVEIEELTVLRPDGAVASIHRRAGNVKERLQATDAIRGSFSKSRVLPQRHTPA